jgi:hypothetical protein
VSLVARNILLAIEAAAKDEDRRARLGQYLLNGC